MNVLSTGEAASVSAGNEGATPPLVVGLDAGVVPKRDCLPKNDCPPTGTRISSEEVGVGLLYNVRSAGRRSTE